jgi:hypothetical protein
MSEGIIVALIMSLAALGGTAYQIRAGAKKNEVDALRGIIDEETKRGDRMALRIEILERSNRALKRWATRLVAQVRELGGDPCEYEE